MSTMSDRHAMMAQYSKDLVLSRIYRDILSGELRAGWREPFSKDDLGIVSANLPRLKEVIKDYQNSVEGMSPEVVFSPEAVVSVHEILVVAGKAFRARVVREHQEQMAALPTYTTRHLLGILADIRSRREYPDDWERYGEQLKYLVAVRAELRKREHVRRKRDSLRLKQRAS